MGYGYPWMDIVCLTLMTELDLFFSLTRFFLLIDLLFGFDCCIYDMDVWADMYWFINESKLYLVHSGYNYPIDISRVIV